jgi:hypothetical protein
LKRASSLPHLEVDLDSPTSFAEGFADHLGERLQDQGIRKSSS